jgi:hypothetical protein
MASDKEDLLEVPPKPLFGERGVLVHHLESDHCSWVHPVDARELMAQGGYEILEWPERLLNRPSAGESLDAPGGIRSPYTTRVQDVGRADGGPIAMLQNKGKVTYRQRTKRSGKNAEPRTET